MRDKQSGQAGMNLPSFAQSLANQFGASSQCDRLRRAGTVKHSSLFFPSFRVVAIACVRVGLTGAVLRNP